MFDKNHYMIVPDNEDTKIRRYMNLRKFESLLKEEALYFCK